MKDEMIQTDAPQNPQKKRITLGTILGLQVIVAIYTLSGVLSKFAAAQEFMSWPFILLYGGEVAILGKARGSKNGSNMLRDLVEKSGGIHFDLPFALAYTGLEDSLLRKYIADSASLYEDKTSDLPVYPIGSTIGTHVGPGAIAVAFFSND